LSVYLTLQRYDDAVALIEREQLAAGADEQNLQLLCDLYQQTKNFDQAARIAEQLVDKYPTQKAHRLRLAVSYEELGRSQAALQVLEHAEKEGLLQQENELLALADLAQKLGQRCGDMVERHMRAGQIRATPENQLRLARCWLTAKDADRASEALARLDEDAVPGDVFLELGKLYARSEQWQKAREPLALSLSRNVTSPGEAELFLGIAHYQLRDKESALQALGKAEGHADTSTCARQWIGLVKRARPSAEATCP
jgi:uncharacterized protein HemY